MDEALLQKSDFCNKSAKFAASLYIGKKQIYMLIPWLSLLDIGSVRANFIEPIDINKIKTHSPDFSLLVPIYNDLKYLKNIDFLKKYGCRVVLCTTTNETPDFITEIEKICVEYGFRLILCDIGSGDKNPWAIYSYAFFANEKVFGRVTRMIKSEYIIFIDGDTVVKESLTKLCGAMRETGYDLASVKVLPSKRETIMEKLQGIEYDVAMQTRLIYPWLTSGAGMVAKRKTIMNIMKNHSFFFHGGDIEIGKLADMMGYKVGHLPMIFLTDIPSSFKAWVKQRFLWMSGCFRHSIINAHHNLRYPYHFIYFTFVIYILFPFKIIEISKHLYFLPILISFYALLTYLVNWKVRNNWMIVFPFYALFQVLAITWFGVYRYIASSLKSKNLGLIQMTHNPKKVPKYGGNLIFNLSKIALFLFIIGLAASSFEQKLILNRTYQPIEYGTMAKDLSAKISKKALSLAQNAYASQTASVIYIRE